MDKTSTPKSKSTEEVSTSTNGTVANAIPTPVIMPAPTAVIEPAVTAALLPAANTIIPSGTWPPPIYVDQTASISERYYMEHRWYSQWNYYDKKASEAKKLHQRFQLIAAIGAATVTLMISISTIAGDIVWRNVFTVLTAILSLVVTSATSIEAIKKYSDNWHNYRSTAEELKREKSLYDVKSGPYRKSKRAFLLFVERCEDIMAKQNGSWAALSREDQPAAGAPAPGGQPSSTPPQAGQTADEDLG